MTIFSILFQFVMNTVAKYKIDESHGLSHAFQVLTQANSIYESEVIKIPELKEHEKVIYIAAIVHDMCDDKYMSTETGLDTIERFLSTIEDFKLTQSEIKAIRNIINTMSYSKVKKNGFPELGEYQHAYHIVREADLLCAYDFDRCMLYHMHSRNTGIENAFNDSCKLFDIRVFKHNDDELFTTDYSKTQSTIMELQSRERMEHWRKLLDADV